MTDFPDDFVKIEPTKPHKADVAVALFQMRGSRKLSFTWNRELFNVEHVDVAFQEEGFQIAMKAGRDLSVGMCPGTDGARLIVRCPIPEGVHPRVNRTGCEYEVLDGILYVTLPIDWRNPEMKALPAPATPKVVGTWRPGGPGRPPTTGSAVMPIPGDPPPGRSALDQKAGKA